MSLKRLFSSTSRLPTATTTTTTAAPLRRTKDPLLSSSSAQHFILPSGATFTVRPPPSSLPSTLPIPSVTSSSLPLFASSSSPFLLPPTFPSSSSRPPPSPHPTLSHADIASLQALRISNPVHWTRSRLAAKFGIPATVVGTLGWGEGVEAKRAEKERREVVVGEKMRKEGAWGWKKAVAREERRRRRALW